MCADNTSKPTKRRRGLPKPPEVLTPDILSRCTCFEFKWAKHTCPFAEDIRDDYTTQCTCCPHCAQQCQDDI